MNFNMYSLILVLGVSFRLSGNCNKDLFCYSQNYNINTDGNQDSNSRSKALTRTGTLAFNCVFRCLNLLYKDESVYVCMCVCPAAC